MENKLYAEKMERRARFETSMAKVADAAAEFRTKQYIVDDLISADYAATQQGTFKHIDKIKLRWVRPDWFEYLPDMQAPFSFTRASGETIRPGAMLTDGGSIPRKLWVKEDLSPWCYAPAFLVHDWEFDLHHQQDSSKDFNAVRDTIAEGLKTLMETGICPRSEGTFRMIYAGVSSWIAKGIWDGVN